MDLLPTVLLRDSLLEEESSALRRALARHGGRFQHQLAPEAGVTLYMCAAAVPRTAFPVFPARLIIALTLTYRPCAGHVRHRTADWDGSAQVLLAS